MTTNTPAREPSSRYTAKGSANTVAASKNDTPCFVMFDAAFDARPRIRGVTWLGAIAFTAASLTTGDAKRDGHLHSPDFLDVEKYPEMRFRSTSIKQSSDDEFRIEGELTIKDITRSVTLSGEFLGWGPNMQGEPMLAASAKTTIDREDWGMTWNVAAESGGFLVGKKVDLEIEVEAHRVG